MIDLSNGFAGLSGRQLVGMVRHPPYIFADGDAAKELLRRGERKVLESLASKYRGAAWVLNPYRGVRFDFEAVAK